MAENTRIIFHIGLTKTGTTYLQKNIFPFLFQETYNFYGKPHSWHSFRGGNYVEGENNFWSNEDSWMGGEDPLLPKVLLEDRCFLVLPRLSSV